MSRILLADDSVHAQHMGARILEEEGFEVSQVTDGADAMERLSELDPDLILGDVFLPGASGYKICEYVKTTPRHRHVRVVLTAGLLEPFDEAEAARVKADAVIKKPFEASTVVKTIKPLADAASFARGLFAEFAAAELTAQKALTGEIEIPVIPAIPDGDAPGLDAERIRAAVTVALDRALPNMIEEITERVLVALGH